jgi:glycosyltransferase involved in cell wall biosynthesis
MRVLHLDSGRAMGGGQWQVLRLIEGLAAGGVESVLLARAGAPLFDRARRRGFRVEPFGVARAFTLARSHDLVHAHDARGHTLGAVLGVPRLVVSRRVAFPIRSRWKYRRAVRYIAVSEFVKSVLIRGGVPAEKIDVVYDGVPLLPLEPGDRVLAASKGRDLAMKTGVELAIATDLEYELPGTAIFIYLTDCEGLGSGALLAMSAGAAVVASQTGGLTEIVRHGENGLLVENRVEAVAQAVRRLQEDPQFARRLGEAARRTVEDRFTIDRMVRRTMEVYRRVLA